MNRTMPVVLAAALLVAGGCSGSDGAGTSTAPDDSVGPSSTDDTAGSDLEVATSLVPPERVPFGTSAHVGEGWHLTVVAVDPDAAATATQLGKPPAPGESFVLFDITLEYKGQDAMGSPPGLVGMRLVGADGAGHDEWCNISMERQLNYQSLVESGDSITGQVCYRFPTEELGAMVLVAGTGERTEKAFALG